MKYQANKDKIAKKYDSKERAMKYQTNKDRIAKRYQEIKIIIAQRHQRNKDIIAKKFDKEKGAKMYKKVMAKIKQNRKELKTNKESKEGYHFSELCKKLFYNVYYKINKAKRL